MNSDHERIAAAELFLDQRNGKYSYVMSHMEEMETLYIRDIMLHVLVLQNFILTGDTHQKF